MCSCFVTKPVLRRVVRNSPNLQAGGPHLIGCPRLLIQYIRSYPSYWRPFLHPQPEDAPCRGDRDPLITDQWPHDDAMLSPLSYSYSTHANTSQVLALSALHRYSLHSPLYQRSSQAKISFIGQLFVQAFVLVHKTCI